MVYKKKQHLIFSAAHLKNCLLYFRRTHSVQNLLQIHVIYPTVRIQGGAEPTDTFRIGILRRRDSLSWLAARGTVEKRTPFHMVRNNMAVREMFGTVISRFGDIAWPARSPDLTVPDFFLWGFLKDRVFWRRIMTIQELKQAIFDEVAAIDGDLRRRV